MKGLGNYSNSERRTERKPAQLVAYQASRAHVRFHDGTTYTIAAEPLRKLGVSEGSMFFMVTVWAGRTPVEARVELPAPARGSMQKMRTPKMYVRDGRRVATKKPPSQ